MCDLASRPIRSGRPRVDITDEHWRALDAGEFTAEQLAAKLGCSKTTIARRRRERFTPTTHEVERGANTCSDC